ncbi:MAG: histidine phosphatase family protein [Gammaproteobacteria bacterium]|nr:histidine phosphatase family protein [Gammaproteobacteria bacterium]
MNSIKELLILRSGKSDWSMDVDDVHRPLKKRGKQAAQKMGIWMAQNGLFPDYVVCSPAKRALDTAEKTCKALGLHHLNIHHDRRVYQSGIEELFNVLYEIPDSVKRILLVGHNPELESLLQNLLMDIVIPKEGKLLPSGTLAQLQIKSDWSQLNKNAVNLVSLVYPDSLPNKFPFPAANGTECRTRPAYYYTQSAVIPYRIKKNVLEILIVSSSSNRHWTIPKGIKEPELTPQESALKEAYEEAGVRGQIDNELLGQYKYVKWGNICTVDVYPMEVMEIIDEHEWEESYRSRRWVSAKKAGRMLRYEEVSKMINELKEKLHV